jgi:hypothetical protein
MKILLNLENALAGYLASMTGASCVAAANDNTLPAKPHAIVKASIDDARMGATLAGRVDVMLHYNPRQGGDDNGTGADEIYAIADDIQTALSDSSACLATINLGASYLYQILRFGAASMEADGERGRMLLLTAFWSGRKI